MTSDELGSEALRRRVLFHEAAELELRGQIATLERSLRRARALCAAFVVVVAIVPLVLMFTPVRLRGVIAQRVEVRDESGHLRVALDAAADRAALVLYAPSGSERASLVATEDESALYLPAPERGQEVALSSGADKAELTLSRPAKSGSEADRLTLQADAEGATLALAGQAGHARLDAVSAQLELTSGAGAAALGARTLTLSEPDGARAAIRAEDGASALVLSRGDPKQLLTLSTEARGASLRVVAGAHEARLSGDDLTLSGPDGSAQLTGPRQARSGAPRAKPARSAQR